VFSCVTTSILPSNAWLPPVWSAWVCVLMIVVIGLSVIFLTKSMIAWPDPGFLVSTTTTPLFCVTKIVVVAPGATLWLKIGS
jgi:hypothetical protein